MAASREAAAFLPEAADLPPLLRAPGAVLFRTPAGDLSAASCLRAAHRLAAALPAAPSIVNLCQGRLGFAIGFLAALLRGQVSLLSADRSEARLAALAARFPDSCSIGDDPAIASPFRHVHLAAPVAEGDGDLPDLAAIPAAREVALVFTSGSTGEPMAHRKTWGALVQRSLTAARRFGLNRPTGARPWSIVATVPPQHMYGFETSVLLPLHAPVSVWCGAAFYPGDIAAALAAVKPPRLLITTPLQLRALLDAAVRMPAVAGVISATAPLAAEFAARAEAAWRTEVREIFGATEVGSIASRRTTREADWLLYDGLTLSLHNGIAVVAAPYAEPTPLADEIVHRPDGRFGLLGRKSDMVKLAGKRASLAGLTRILAGIDGVRDGVFVAPDDLDARPSARLLAFAVAPDRSAADILAALRRRVDPAFLPRRVVLLDALPRNEAGKLTRAALAAIDATRDA